MKKLICLLGHNKRLMKINDCIKERFENEDRAIVVYTCKYCDADIHVRTLYINAKFKNPKDTI